MGSSRLPGKVMSNIDGKPMLWHVINRLRKAKKIGEIILAIPDTEENDVLEKFAKENNVKYFRGSEKDVLSRYYCAAKKFKIDMILRITSDCPLVDPELADLLIEKHLNSGADYTSNVQKRTFPRGLDMEVFNFEALEKAHKKAGENYQREHVTPYIYEHPEIFNLRSVGAEGKLKNPDLRLTVDMKEDLELVREVYKRLNKPEEIFGTEKIIDLFSEKPELAEINKDVRQKETK